MTRGHLRRFYTALVAEGGSYTPKYLERTMFEQVLTAADEPDGMGCTGCMGEGMGMGRRHGGGRPRVGARRDRLGQREPDVLHFAGHEPRSVAARTGRVSYAAIE